MLVRWIPGRRSRVRAKWPSPNRQNSEATRVPVKSQCKLPPSSAEADKTNSDEHRRRGQVFWFQILAFPPRSCVHLGWVIFILSLYFRFTTCKMGIMIISTSESRRTKYLWKVHSKRYLSSYSFRHKYTQKVICPIKEKKIIILLILVLFQIPEI